MTAFQNPMLIALATCVKTRRSELQISQEELAQIMDVPLNVIVEIENGINNEYLSAKNKTLRVLALALNLPENALFSYPEQ